MKPPLEPSIKRLGVLTHVVTLDCVPHEHGYNPQTGSTRRQRSTWKSRRRV
jgi:hypothetical protein